MESLFDKDMKSWQSFAGWDWDRNRDSPDNNHEATYTLTSANALLGSSDGSGSEGVDGSAGQHRHHSIPTLAPTTSVDVAAPTPPSPVVVEDDAAISNPPSIHYLSTETESKERDPNAEEWDQNEAVSEGQMDLDSASNTDSHSDAVDCFSNSPRPPDILSIPRFHESQRVSVELPESTLIVPRSFYEPFDPGVPIISERLALDRLLKEIQGSLGPEDDYVELCLEDFAVYSDYAHYGLEMRSLHHLSTAITGANFFFDGILSNGQTKLFVRHVPIKNLPIGNYGSVEEHTVGGDIWIESPISARNNVFYKLGKPAKEYRRFFEPFLWVSDLCKHFVDYLDDMGSHDRRVCIADFRSHFYNWAVSAHGKDLSFLRWAQQHPSHDFRTAIVANLAFLEKETFDVLDIETARAHTLWDEVLSFNQYRLPPQKQNQDAIPSTIVTSYVKECFQHMPFGDLLEAVPLDKRAALMRQKVLREIQLERPHSLHTTSKNVSSVARGHIRDIKPGDTISTHRDDIESGSKWKREEARDFDDVDRWFALVQQVHTRPNGEKRFDVTWYYRPVDTICGLMKYPWNNELFLSDHCSCDERTKITEAEVLGVHSVDFHGTSTTSAEFFCRQTYMQTEHKWVSLETHHHICEHRRHVEIKPEYSPGETVLVHLDRQSEYCEPCEIVEASQRGRSTSFVYELRRLLRRQEVEPLTFKGPRNELVYTDTRISQTSRAILGRCYVRFFKVGEHIPTPYNRNGVGGFFYMTQELQSSAEHGGPSLVPLDTAPASLKQGFDPCIPVPKLRGLDLFCGGGNFGRGLEDGGGIKMEWANDYDTKAIHTYMANVESTSEVHPFLGSIDVLSRMAIEGNFSDSVPKIGDVDFISAGSPCPGFSVLTNDKTTIKQRKNQSLVAAFASFVDLYRPKFGLLENVPGIVQRNFRTQDVFSQLICALVGLGYQTQFYYLDASSCGSLQLRSRVFVSFAAPGFRLPERPQQTHSPPPGLRTTSLGMLPNGEPMATRVIPGATPFRHLTCEEAMGDLPRIHDAKVGTCVPFPDHRVSFGITRQARLEIYHVPNRPYAMSFAKAWFGRDLRGKPGSGILTASERGFYPEETKTVWRVQKNSNAWSRVNPQGLSSAVTTTPNYRDAKSGKILDWSDNRALTVMEARRAQGFRDHEVLLGNVADQFKIVGNSVAREVSVALGVAFREAWLASIGYGRGSDGAVEAALPASFTADVVAGGSMRTPILAGDEDFPSPPSPTLAAKDNNVAIYEKDLSKVPGSVSTSTSPSSCNNFCSGTGTRIPPESATMMTASTPSTASIFTVNCKRPAPTSSRSATSPLPVSKAPRLSELPRTMTPGTKYLVSAYQHPMAQQLASRPAQHSASSTTPSESSSSYSSGSRPTTIITTTTDKSAPGREITILE